MAAPPDPAAAADARSPPFPSPPPTDGVYQAELYRKQPDGSKFSATAFVLLAQCLFNAAVAFCFAGAFAMLGEVRKPHVDKETKAALPLTPLGRVLGSRDVMVVAAVYVFAMYSSNEALRYVPYSMQALVKSCKMVPVMIGSILINGERYSLRKWVSVALVSLGITVFSMLGGEGKPKHAVGGGADSNSLGLLLLAASLALDGASGPLQKKVERHGLTNTQQMAMTNVWASVYMFGVAAALGQLDTAVRRRDWCGLGGAAAET